MIWLVVLGVIVVSLLASMLIGACIREGRAEQFRHPVLHDPPQHVKRIKDAS